MPAGTARASRRKFALVLAATLFTSIGSTVPLRADFTLTNIHAPLVSVWRSAVGWGDYDADGDLDLVITGDTTFQAVAVSRIYRNEGGSFVDTHANLVKVEEGAAPWGDFDADGDLDLMLTGYDPRGGTVSSLYRYDSDGVFRRLAVGIDQALFAIGAWVDCDNDGDLDLMVGSFGEPQPTPVFRNEGNGLFTRVNLGLPPPNWSAAWADYDNDGDQDISMSNLLYRNQGNGTFVDAHAGLTIPSWSAVAWGDYDNDGDLDILVAGVDPDSPTAQSLLRIYRNDGSDHFVDIHAFSEGLNRGSVHWVDFDNDGYLDVFVTGCPFNSIYGAKFTRLYRSDQAGHFLPVPLDLPPGGADSDWGDYDNDGDLDLMLTGINYSATPGRLSAIFRNDGVPPNAPPAAPTGLESHIEGDRLVMSWDRAIDDRTPSLGLSYNLRLGTAPGRDDIVPCMANTITGYRRLTALGNVSERTSWSIKLPAMWDVLYWSVQAIDASYAGSPFATEQVIGGVPVLASNVSAEAGPEGVRLVWYLAGEGSRTAVVYRREELTDWIALKTVSADASGYLQFVDASVAPGRRYAYRLGLSGGVFSQEVWIDMPRGQLAFALDGIAPNPSRSQGFATTFSLPTSSPASLELIDARGRILTRHAFAAAGRYTIHLGVPDRLAAGIYFLRLTQTGRSVDRRVTLLD